MNTLGGVVGALLTPFRGEGVPDARVLEMEWDFIVGHCDAVSVLGAEVSEYRWLAASERRALLRHAVSELSGRTTVIGGISAPSFPEVMELARIVAEAGGHYVQFLIPSASWGGPARDGDLVKLVSRVAAESPLPVVLYHHPGPGGDPTLRTLVELCSIEGVAAIKDSSRDIRRNIRAVEEIQLDGHAAYLGTIQPMLAVMLSGGAGAMMPPPFTLLGARIRDAMQTGDLEAAGRAQRAAASVKQEWAAWGLAPLAKRLMEIMGIPVGPPAWPYSPLPEAETEELEHLVSTWLGDGVVASSVAQG